MKPLNQQNNIQTNTSADFNFTIKTSAHAFKILSDSLYKNKVLAVVREYLTNALDAHKENDKLDTPIELSMSVDNEWSVRDFGKGLSEEDIQNLFCTYFSSSKTETNEQTGMLGLGCKSGFAYTEEFTVTSWFNGFKTIYHLYVDNSTPKVSIINKKPSDEPTGLKVSLQVKKEDISSFTHKEFEVLKHFPLSIIPETYKTDVENYQKNLINLETCYISNVSSNPYVLMGNILYPLDISLLPNLKYANNKTSRKIFKLANGSVSILPSREGLSYDKHTVNFLTKFINRSFEETKKWVGSYTKVAKPKPKNTYKVHNTFITNKYVSGYINELSYNLRRFSKSFNLNFKLKEEEFIFNNYDARNLQHFYDSELTSLGEEGYIILETKLRSSKENIIIKEWLEKNTSYKILVYKVKHKFYKKEVRKILKIVFNNKIFNSYQEFFNFIYPNGLPKAEKQVKTFSNKPKQAYKLYEVLDKNKNSVSLPLKEIKELSKDPKNYFLLNTEAYYHINSVVDKLNLDINPYYVDNYVISCLYNFNFINYKEQFNSLVKTTFETNYHEDLILMHLGMMFSRYSIWDYLMKPNSIYWIYNCKPYILTEEYIDNFEDIRTVYSNFDPDQIDNVFKLNLTPDTIHSIIRNSVIEWFKINDMEQCILLWLKYTQTVPRCDLEEVIEHLGKKESFTQLLKDIANDLIKQSQSNSQ